MLVSKKLKFALPPMQNPNVSQWNIGCVGDPTQNFHIGHVHFMLFVLISFALGTHRKAILQWNMGFNCRYRVEYGLKTLLNLSVYPVF